MKLNKTVISFFFMAILYSVVSCNRSLVNKKIDEWSNVEVIVKQIALPVFPQREYEINQFWSDRRFCY